MNLHSTGFSCTAWEAKQRVWKVEMLCCHLQPWVCPLDSQPHRLHPRADLSSFLLAQANTSNMPACAFRFPVGLPLSPVTLPTPCSFSLCDCVFLNLCFSKTSSFHLSFPWSYPLSLPALCVRAITCAGKQNSAAVPRAWLARLLVCDRSASFSSKLKFWPLILASFMAVA